MAIASALRMGAEGIKVKVSGRLGGAEIARSEEIQTRSCSLAYVPYGY